MRIVLAWWCFLFAFGFQESKDEGSSAKEKDDVPYVHPDWLAVRDEYREQERQVIERLREIYATQKDNLPEGLILSVSGLGIMVEGSMHPDKIRIVDGLDLCSLSLHKYFAAESRELMVRGFDSEDMDHLVKWATGDYWYDAYLRRLLDASREAFFERFKDGKITDDEAKTWIENSIEARDKAIRLWGENILGGLSNRSRRVLISFVRERYISHMGKSYVLGEPTQEMIDGSKKSLMKALHKSGGENE